MALKVDQRFSHEHVQEYQDEDLIFSEGDPGRDLYLVQDGGVVIRKKTPLGEIELARFAKGDFFGDMALLQGLPRYASAYARGATRLLILQPGGFLLKIRRDPTLAFEMLQQLSYRVRVSNERLMETISKAGFSKDAVQDILNSIGG